MGVSEERSVPIPLGAEGLSLEGLYVSVASGERGAVIAPPHPLYGGNMDSPVVNELAHACHGAGWASLRFNWRGVGASGGLPSGESGDADADYGAALDQIAETVGGPLAACGYSFGAAAAVRCAGADRIERLVLVAPPPSLLDPAALAAFPGRTLILAGEADTIAPPAALESLADGTRTEVIRIPEADHFFTFGLAPIGQKTRAWLE